LYIDDVKQSAEAYEEWKRKYIKPEAPHYTPVK